MPSRPACGLPWLVKDMSYLGFGLQPIGMKPLGLMYYKVTVPICSCYCYLLKLSCSLCSFTRDSSELNIKG